MNLIGARQRQACRHGTGSESEGMQGRRTNTRLLCGAQLSKVYRLNLLVCKAGGGTGVNYMQYAPVRRTEGAA